MSIHLKSHISSLQGAQNYWYDDVNYLLDIVADQAPQCRKEWELIASDFNHWCQLNDRPTRSVESLESKLYKIS